MLQQCLISAENIKEKVYLHNFLAESFKRLGALSQGLKCKAGKKLVVQAVHDLDWHPQFGLLDGLADSYEKDFARGTFRKEPDFSVDDKVIAAVK